MLHKLGKEVAGIEHVHVFLEILVVMGVKEHPTLKSIRKGSSSRI